METEQIAVTDEVEWSLTDTLVWIASRQGSAVRDSRAAGANPLHIVLFRSLDSCPDVETAWRWLREAISKGRVHAPRYSSNYKLQITSQSENDRKYIRFVDDMNNAVEEVEFKVAEVLAAFPRPPHPDDQPIDFENSELSLYAAAVFLTRGGNTITYREAQAGDILDRGLEQLLEGLRQGSLSADGINPRTGDAMPIPSHDWRNAYTECKDGSHLVSVLDYERGYLDGSTAAGGSMFPYVDAASIRRYSKEGINEAYRARWVKITIPKEQLIALRGMPARGEKRRNLAKNLDGRTKEYPRSDLDAWLAEINERWRTAKRSGLKVDFRRDDGFQRAAQKQFPDIGIEVIRTYLWTRFEGRKQRHREK